VNDSQSFLLEHFDTIQDSPFQIYRSALPLSPSTSWLHKCYSAELSQEVKAVKGPLAGWRACSRTVVLDGVPQALACWKDTIAVGLQSGDITIINAITGSQAAVLSGHTDWVQSLAFSLDGISLVSGSQDTSLKLWDVQTGGVVKTFSGHTSCVLSISSSSDGTLVASGSCDGTVRLWNIQKGECCCVIKHQEIVDCVVFSPTDPQHLISVSDGIAQQWDISGCQIGPIYQGSHPAFSSDGTHFVLCSGNVATVQNSDSGAVVAKCLAPNNNPNTSPNFTHSCFSPNSGLIAVAARNTVYVWDITGPDPLLIKAFIGHASIINSLIFSSPSTLISASRDQSVKFWQIGTLSPDPITGDPESINPTSASIKSVSLQVEDSIAISSDLDGVVKIWDISMGLCKASFQTPAKDPYWRDG
jgi:WD40 repeat protein